MADYRQECGNPACSYTGFSGHSPGCPVPFEALERERNQRAEEVAEQKKWDDFFEAMSDESLFRYVDNCQETLDRVAKFKKRRDKAMDYMRRKHKAVKYIDWTRNK